MPSKTQRLYILSVQFPQDALNEATCIDCGEYVHVRRDGSATHSDGERIEAEDVVWALNPDWEPEGWLADPESRDHWIERFGDATFFWPKVDKIYFTKGTARTRARLLESYGATVTIVESEPIVWLTPERIRENRIHELTDELARLRGE